MAYGVQCWVLFNTIMEVLTQYFEIPFKQTLWTRLGQLASLTRGRAARRKKTLQTLKGILYRDSKRTPGIICYAAFALSPINFRSYYYAHSSPIRQSWGVSANPVMVNLPDHVMIRWLGILSQAWPKVLRCRRVFHTVSGSEWARLFLELMLWCLSLLLDVIKLLTLSSSLFMEPMSRHIMFYEDGGLHTLLLWW